MPELQEGQLEHNHIVDLINELNSDERFTEEAKVNTIAAAFMYMKNIKNANIDNAFIFSKAVWKNS